MGYLSKKIYGLSIEAKNIKKQNKGIIAGIFKHILAIPYFFLLCLNLLFVYVLVNKVFLGLKTINLGTLLRNFVYNNTNVSIFDAMGTTARLSIASAIIAVLCTLIISFIVGFKDRWTFGNCSQKIKEVTIFLALIPSSVIAYMFYSFMLRFPWITAIILLSVTGILLGLFLLQESLFVRINAYEWFRKSFSIASKKTRIKIFIKYVFPIFILFFVFCFLLSWNDVVVQLFAQTDLNGLPNLLLPLGRDGLSEIQNALFSIIQIIMLVFALPYFIFVGRFLKRQKIN